MYRPFSYFLSGKNYRLCKLCKYLVGDLKCSGCASVSMWTSSFILSWGERVLGPVATAVYLWVVFHVSRSQCHLLVSFSASCLLCVCQRRSQWCSLRKGQTGPVQSSGFSDEGEGRNSHLPGPQWERFSDFSHIRGNFVILSCLSY